MAILAMLIGLASFICFIIVLIKQFQNAGIVHGIIGIITCGIWTFIWGWMNASNLNIKNIMMAWTAVILLCIVLQFAFGLSMMPYGYSPTPVTPTTP